MQNLIPTESLSILDDEPRVLDVDLAEWLGLERLTNIRTVIVANLEEIEMHGSLHVANANPGKQGGRPGKAYYLNEGQALVICALSRTPKAAEVRKALIDVFMAYRTGKLVHVREHRRSPPRRRQWGNVTGYDANLSLLRAVAGNQEGMLSVLAGMITRIETLESAR